MAVANTKSTVITNADSTTRTTNNGYLSRAPLNETVGFVEVAAADDNNSVYRFVRVPSNARISQINLFSDAITGGTDYDFGVYQTAANGGAVVLVNAFADAVDLSSGVAGTDITFEYLNIDKIEKRLWEVLGLTADPKCEYDICATGVAVGSGAGTISLRVRYVV